MKVRQNLRQKNALKELDSIYYTFNIFKAFLDTPDETFSNESIHKKKEAQSRLRVSI